MSNGLWEVSCRQSGELRTGVTRIMARFVAGRVTELALKSTAGTLSQDEQAEYEHIVRLNDLLSVLKLQTEEYWAPRIAS